MRNEITTVKLSKKTVELLNKLKIHPRQPYEEVILKLIRERDEPKKGFVAKNEPAAKHSKKEITTIKLARKTAEILNNLKIHPRQPYEEVILNLISQNEEARKKTK